MFRTKKEFVCLDLRRARVHWKKQRAITFCMMQALVPERAAPARARAFPRRSGSIGSAKRAAGIRSDIRSARCAVSCRSDRDVTVTDRGMNQYNGVVLLTDDLPRSNCWCAGLERSP